jgi:hypothetical protein
MGSVRISIKVWAGKERGATGGRLVFCTAALAAIGGALLAAPEQEAAPKPRPTTESPAAFPGGPYFVVGCGFSHRNNDDPIVFPGEPGKSHNHTYVGSRSVDAFSTAASLRKSDTTCGNPADSSTYWTPTLYVGGDPVPPLVGLAYYVRRTVERVVPIPAGLKMVAGNPFAKRAQNKKIVSWSCGGIRGLPRYSVVPGCSVNRALQLRVTFPNCWTGRTLDSPDHTRHMAYSSRGRCPQSHSVAIPTIALIFFYPPMPSRAVVSSGRFAAHADFINGWDQDVLDYISAGLNSREIDS